jgi:ABC-type Fe3+ transport system permease subunit
MFSWLHLTDTELQALHLSLSVALRSVLFSLPVAIAVAWLLTRRVLSDACCWMRLYICRWCCHR